jgi:endo-1,4-beta-xylanase
VNSIGAAQLYIRLKTAEIPAEIHIYNSGGHGFGVRPTSTKPVNEWPEVFVDWLADRGLIAAR